MKRIVTTCLWIALSALTTGAETPEEILRRGLFEEEGNQNLDKAKESFLKLAQGYDQQRRYAATAFFRLGEIARKQGNREEAAKWYRRVVSEFPADKTLARLSRQNLKGLGFEAAGAGEAPNAPAAVDEQVAEVARLKALRRSSPDLIDGVDEKGWRPIHHASAKGWLEVLDYVLGEGAAVDGETSREKWTPLHLAVAHGHLAVVNRLLKAGANTERGATFPKSTQTSSTHKGMPPAPSRLEGSWRPLHLAILWRRREVAKALLDAKCERDSVEPYFEGSYVTPLMLATITKQEDLISLLVTAGADINVKAERSEWPITALAMKRAPELLPLLLANGADPNFLIPAVQSYPKSLPALLKGGAEVDRTDQNGYTALHWARDVESAQLLLDAGAEIDKKAQAGETPLLMAAIAGAVEVVGLLLERGADPTVKSSHGRGLFDVANQMVIPEIWERFRYADALRDDAVMIAHHSSLGVNRTGQAAPGFSPVSILALRRGDGFKPPALAEALVGFGTVYRIRILRRGENGLLKTIFSVSESDPAERIPPFPPLRWGDLVEVLEWEDVNANQINCNLWWDSLPAREVTIQADRWQRILRIDPAVAPSGGGEQTQPWRQLDARHHMSRSDEFVTPVGSTVLRGDATAVFGEKLRSEGPFLLQNGDTVVLKVHDALVQNKEDRWKGIRIFNAMTFEEIVPRRNRGATLFALLWREHESRPHRDFFNGLNLSSVIIQRPEGGELKEIKVDIKAAAAEFFAKQSLKASAPDLSKDVELKSGDLLILFPKKQKQIFGEKLERPDQQVLDYLEAVWKAAPRLVIPSSRNR